MSPVSVLDCEGRGRAFHEVDSGVLIARGSEFRTPDFVGRLGGTVVEILPSQCACDSWLANKGVVRDSVLYRVGLPPFRFDIHGR